MKIETLAVHAGQAIDPSTGAVALPIHLSTTFERDPDGSFPRGFNYARSNNPTREALERGLAALEGGSSAVAFGSGSAATAAMLQALAPGDHVLASADLYHGTTRLFQDLFVQWGLRVSFVDFSKIGDVEKAMTSKTKLVFVETPSNPLLKITDIAEVSKIAHAGGARCVCDNTWAPIFQRPFDHGADLIVHSTTKYLGGHSDVSGGVVITKADDDFSKRIREIQRSGGAVPSPFDCWLILRGMRTLPWRMRAHAENASKVAAFLQNHERVGCVYYPGLKSHQGHQLAARQMSAFGGMLSFEIKGDKEAAMAVAARTRLFTRATSLGGVESLIEHRASIEGPETRTSQSLLRLSIGLEHADDLIEDLEQALR